MQPRTENIVVIMCLLGVLAICTMTFASGSILKNVLRQTYELEQRVERMHDAIDSN